MQGLASWPACQVDEKEVATHAGSAHTRSASLERGERVVFADGRLTPEFEHATLPLDQSTSYKLTAVVAIPPEFSKGTIVAQASVDHLGNGIWRDGRTVGGAVAQGKILGFRAGRPFFDIGWIGYLQSDGDVQINDGSEHIVALTFDGAQYHMAVDGRAVSCYRSPNLEHGNQAECGDGDSEFRILVAAGIGPELDARGRKPTDRLFDEATRLVRAGMGPRIPLSCVRELRFLAPLEQAVNLIVTPYPILASPSAVDSAEKDQLREGRLAWSARGVQRPFLFVPRGYRADAEEAQFAEGILDGLSSLYGGRARPALVFQVNKVVSDNEFVPHDPLREQFAQQFDAMPSGDLAADLAAGGAVGVAAATRALAADCEASALDMATLMRCTSVVEHSQSVLEAKVRALMCSVMTTCDQAGAWVLFDFPWTSNALCTWVCEAAPPSVVRLGLYSRFDIPFHADSQIDREAATFATLYDAIENRDNTIPLATKGTITPIPIADDQVCATCAHQRVRNLTPQPNLSHYIWFEDALDEERFTRALNESLNIPAGKFLIAGTPHAMRECLKSITSSRPVFVFKHTGARTDTVTHLLETRLAAGTNANLPLPEMCRSCARSGVAKCAHVCQETRVLSENWPEAWNASSVLIIDPLEQNAENLQDKLTKVMSSVFEGVPELGGRAAEIAALEYSWNFHAMLDGNAKLQYRIAQFLHWAVVVATLLTTTSTTVQAQWSDDDGGRLGARALAAVRVANLVLPLATAALLTITSQLKPVSKWAACRLAAHAVEREIFRYRTQVGEYVPRLSRSAAAAAARTPRAVLTTSLQDIWSELSNSDVRLGGLSVPDRPSEKAQLVKKRAAADEDPAVSASGAADSAMENGAAASARDDAFSKLSAEEYIDIRVSIILREKQRSVPFLSRAVFACDAVSILLTSAGTNFVAFGLAAWVPVLLGATAAIAAVANHLGLQPKLRATNVAVASLNKLVLWWQGLTLIQKRANVNKTFLVDATEDCVTAELSAFVSASLSAAKPKDDAADEEDGDGSSGAVNAKKVP